MTIAVTAPQKFAFQDLVCVETMLRFCAHPGATLFVEPDGGEDAELTFAMGGRMVRCEIQVKGAGGAIAIADVAACLAHAPPRRADPTLLERLVGDPDRIALFVMSGRADDASSVYLSKNVWQGEPHKDSRVKATDATTLIAAFAVADVAGSDNGKLKARRQKHNANVAASVDRGGVREALRRTIMFDQVDDAALQARCEERLRRDHGIPSDRTIAVLLELRAAVGEAKLKKTDAFPLLRSILTRASPPPIRPGSYIPRGDEADLVEALSRDNVLLLSGTPRVGKTYAARWIAAEFMPLGYEVQEFVDVDPAERFLLEPGTAPRLALLDDPLGGSQTSADATRSLARLASLIGRTRPQRKLLVAQGVEPLLATDRTNSLDQTVTAHRRWRDMGHPEPAFLVSLWRSLAATFAVDAMLRERVAEPLMAGALTLEPGCLEHLAANTHRLGASATIADVARLAREDAAQLGRELAAEGLEDLCVSLSVATAPQEPIGLVDLAYVRGGGGPGLPGKSSATGRFLTIGGPPVPITAAPAYDQPPELAAADRTGLDALERRRLIAIDGKPAISFAHPFYRAAAETLLEAPTYHVAQAIGHALRRGLFCLSPTTSRATARNLGWIFDRLKANPKERDALVTEAIDGLRSFFPATRDLCFRFLLNRLSDLPAEQQEELPGWIKSVTSITLDNLEWSDGEAHLPYGERSGFDYFERAFQTVRRREVAAELNLLDASEGVIMPERAAAVLRFLATEPETMTATMAGRLLSYDEAALRAAATRLWLSQPRTDDDDILDRIFADDHPSCALAALKGVIAGWNTIDANRRTRHLDGLAALASNAAGAAAMLDHLVLFDREEETGEHPPWQIFERLMPVVMATLPHNAAFIDARLFAVARSALKALSAPSLVALCDGWIGWLERNERAGLLPSEFSLGVADILLQATAAEPELRQASVVRLLAFTGTGAKVTFMADLIAHWELLRTDERSTVFERLTGGFTDDRWLQAVAITRSEVPDEVLRRLLPSGIDLSQPPAQLLDTVPSILIEAAVHVYSGRPQPLWWLGTHHAGEEIWEPVLETIARRPDHPLFELAWDHITYACDGKRVSHIIADLGTASADRMLGILLRLKVGWTGNFMPEAWAALLRLAIDADVHERWLDRMVAASPAILDDISDLDRWLTDPSDFVGVLKKLQNDFLPLQMASVVLDPPEGADVPKLKGDFVKVLTFLVRERPPMLLGTCDHLIRRLERVAVDTAELVTALRDRRAAIMIERTAIKTDMEPPDPPLVGWINP
ncbi:MULTISPECIES: hypothetical protein [Mesorhizobium]|uniref:nSTAND3 domain-containing NTPase n=1 Tax=Mesorhizobium TaxID=68287 RepID=UPI0003CF4AD9|nr:MULTISPECIES: hypothetical protein [Mesorhizobium]ESY71157.1 hypothetical protein X742_01610 [Mesorhizobium sp. LNHC232B00]WJI40922.1 hypothetical protein NL534_12030 [Mesorhizobium opportunistum]